MICSIQQSLIPYMRWISKILSNCLLNCQNYSDNHFKYWCKNTSNTKCSVFISWLIMVIILYFCKWKTSSRRIVKDLIIVPNSIAPKLKSMIVGFWNKLFTQELNVHIFTKLYCIVLDLGHYEHRITVISYKNLGKY